MRFRVVLPCMLAFLPFASLPVQAAGGGPGSGGDPSSGPPVDPRRNQDVSGDITVAQRTPTVAVQLEGRVVDSAGKPLSGILIKTFANGLLVGSAKSDADGTFTLAAHPMRDAKSSAVIWFQTPDPERYVDANVVLWAGKGAQEHHLFPECTQFLKTVGGTGKIEVTMRSVDERKVAVIESRCLEGDVPTSSP